MNKLVNIYPSKPIVELNPPVRCILTRVIVPEEYIKICIDNKAIVEEITSTGKRVILDKNNYNKDNSITEQPVVDKEPEKITENVKVEEKISEIEKKIENKKYSNKKNKYKNKQQSSTQQQSTSTDNKKEVVEEEVVNSVLDIENLNK